MAAESLRLLRTAVTRIGMAGLEPGHHRGFLLLLVCGNFYNERYIRQTHVSFPMRMSMVIFNIADNFCY